MQKSTLQERPWSEYEKLSLLAEILKLSPVPAGVLAKLIKDFEVNPRWEDIPLPEGRSLNSSKFAFDEIYRQTRYYPVHTSTAFSQQRPQSRDTATAIPRKRPLPGAEALNPSFPAIQPRPPGISPAPFTPVLGESGGSVRLSPRDSAGEPGRKRRGRPSNAQIEQEKAAAAAEGRVWQPRPQRAPRKKKSKPSGELGDESNEAAPPNESFPETPKVHTGDGDEDGSSGKKRHKKMRDEAAMVRAPPYDPVRQSPSRASPVTAGTPPIFLEYQPPPQPHVPALPKSDIDPGCRPLTPQPGAHTDLSPQALTE